jgi:peptidoglycan/LPS O-acetylase OafA/YrhL
VRVNSGEPWRLGERPALYGLRGVAVLLVLFAHGLMPGVEAAGSVGVVVFFALSGFLIATLLLEETDRNGRVSVRSFYWRRAVRLLPALFVMLAAVSIVDLFHSGFTSPRFQLGTLLYVANWTRMAAGHGTDALGHTWSLAIEEQFYLIAPFVVIALRRHPMRLLGLCAAGAFGSLALRAVLEAAGADGYRIYSGTDVRLDGLLLGVGLAVVMRTWAPRPGRLLTGVAWVAVALAAVGPAGGYWYLVLMPFVVAAATVVVIARSLDGAPFLEARWLRWVGVRSYGVYLWHYPLAMFALRYDGHRWLVLTASVVGGIGLAAVSWAFIERPLLRLRGWRPRSVRAVGLVPS